MVALPCGNLLRNRSCVKPILDLALVALLDAEPEKAGVEARDGLVVEDGVDAGDGRVLQDGACAQEPTVVLKGGQDLGVLALQIVAGVDEVDYFLGRVGGKVFAGELAGIIAEGGVELLVAGNPIDVRGRRAPRSP
ncbi:hypothetical protein [Cerasicoccus frondis]|uniref:hypothetical protein n=1 Tax=Cerasicoccus frondis TaxID=490090 RepID=UPI002852BE24|nr:hypothetical protein [Cerasicoccus frondis]